MSDIDNAIKEITNVISTQMNIVFKSLIQKTDEYEETKTQILNLPFVKKIIREQMNSSSSFCEKEVQEETCCQREIHIDNISCKKEHLESYFQKETLIEEDEPVKTQNIQFSILEKEPTETIPIANLKQLLQEEEDEGVSDEELELEEDEEEVVEIKVEKIKEVIVVEEDQEEVVEVEIKQEEEEEEDEVFEIEIDGTNYYTTNEMYGVIYEVDENGDPGAQVGVFKNGKAVFI